MGSLGEIALELLDALLGLFGHGIVAFAQPLLAAGEELVAPPVDGLFAHLVAPRQRRYRLFLAQQRQNHLGTLFDRQLALLTHCSLLCRACALT